LLEAALMINLHERIQTIPGIFCPIFMCAQTKANLPFNFSAFVF